MKAFKQFSCLMAVLAALLVAGCKIAQPKGSVGYIEELKSKASRGDADSQYALGVIYEQGNEVQQDYVQAANWYRKAADHGLGKAQFWLSRLYDTGQGVKKDQSKAVKWLMKSASQRYAEAQYFLGQRYQEGDGVPKNSTNAVKWFGEAASHGVPWAQFSLGRMYYNGDGITQDRGQSFYWVEKAAAKGLAEAQALLGALYGSGDGIEKDDAEALKWMNKAAGQGMADAQSTLGEMYVRGVGGETNLIQAYKWFALAAKPGDESVRTNLPTLENAMSADELSQARQLVSEFKPFMTNGANCSWSGEQTFSLKPESGTGTGFFVTDDGYLVTNFHIVKDAGEIFVVTPGGTLPAEVVKVDEYHDLALLKVAGQFSPLPVADSRKVRLGSPVVTVGYPAPPLLGFSPKFSKGDIAGLYGESDDPMRFQISVPMQPGNSGGPLLDTYGNVVGIVSQQLDVMRAFNSNGQLPQNVNYAIKSQYLLGFLETIPEVSTKLKPPTLAEKKVEDIAANAEKASVLILIYAKNL